MTRRLLFLTLMPLLSLAGCSESSDGEQPVGLVEIGTGLRPMSFEPLSTDPTLPIEPGIQGGYHVQIALRAADVGPDDVEMDLTIEDAAGARLGGASYVDDFFRDESGRAFYGGVTVFLDFSVDPATVSGQMLLLRAEIADDQGARARGDLRFRAEWDGSTPFDL